MRHRNLAVVAVTMSLVFAAASAKLLSSRTRAAPATTHEEGVRIEAPSASATPTATPNVPPHAAPSPATEASIDAPRDPVEALREGLASSDEFTKIDAVEAAVRDGAVGGLSLLESTELKREPAAAPTIIHATASLAAQGSSRDRSRAARTLDRWLREESVREERDAIGNVPNLIEALGDLGGRESVDAIVSAIDGQKLDLSVETLAVQKLADLGDPRAQDAVSRFAARASALPDGDEFERQLRDEAVAAANAATERLSH